MHVFVSTHPAFADRSKDKTETSNQKTLGALSFTPINTLRTQGAAPPLRGGASNALAEVTGDTELIKLQDHWRHTYPQSR